MTRVLVIGDLVDVVAAPKRHFSLVKGLNLAVALTDHGDVDYLTTGPASSIGALTLRPIDHLVPLDSYDLIVLMREKNLIEILDRVPGLRELLHDRDRSTTVVARGDSFAWMGSRVMRQRYQEAFGRRFLRDVPTMFDVVCAQTPELVDWSLAALPWRLRRVLRRRTLVSPMGVPETNHRLDRPSLRRLAEHPTELLYMGRLKADGGRVIDFLRDVMAELGPDFVLHIYPGSFRLAESPGVNRHPGNPAALELLRQQFRSNAITASNVVVHESFDADEKVDVVTRHSIGLDVSPSRPLDQRSRAGNAKLLEYCWLGLAVVTEETVHNSVLVDECGNGVRLPGVPSAVEYAEAVRRLAAQVVAGSFDPALIAQRTIDNHGWSKIAAPLAALARCHDPALTPTPTAPQPHPNRISATTKAVVPF